MEIFQLVRETIALARAYRCTHKWEKYSDTEDQCQNCGILATEDGKKNLAAESRRRGFLPPDSEEVNK